MPLYSVSVPELVARGPVIDIILLPSSYTTEKLRREGKEIYGEEVRAMIDTGASQTVIAATLPILKHIPDAGISELSTPAAKGVECRVYQMRISFPTEPQTAQIEVACVAAPYVSGDIACLLGRDVLCHAQLVYNGYDERITLCF